MIKTRLKILAGVASAVFGVVGRVGAQTDGGGAVETAKSVAVAKVETARNLVDIAMEFVVKYSFQAVGGFIVLILGWMASQYLGGVVHRLLERKKVDVTVHKFVVSAVKLLIMTFALIVALGKFGIEIAPLIAGLSVAGFGLSFALQGPLSNYASGATLIFTKPFKVKDIIEVAGVMGEVVDMKLSYTQIKTVDGHTIVVPNKHIIGDIIHNYSDVKLLEINVGVSYGSDIDKAIALVREVIKKDARAVKEPNVGISQFAESSVNIYARLWCRQDDYWETMFAVNKNIFDAFKREAIEIPFPQRDVRILQAKGEDAAAVNERLRR